MKSFEITEEHRDELERAWYELNGLQVLARQFCSTSSFKPDKERHQEVIRQFVQANAYYQMLWQDILQTYLPGEKLDGLVPHCEFATRTVELKKP
jgi:hypothetical protein